MAKFSRRDIKQFFQDTIKETYESDGEVLKESAASQKEQPRNLNESKRKSARVSKSKLQDMIREAIRLGYKDRAEYYGGPNRAMDMGDENLDPVDDEMGLRFMGDLPYSIDDSSDVMDSEDLDLYPSDELGGLERRMRRGGHRLSSHLYDDEEVDDMEMPYMGFDDPLVMEGAAQGDTQVDPDALAVLAMSPFLLSGYVLHPQVRGMINPHVKKGEEALKNWVEQNKADWEPLLDQLGVL